MSDVILFQREHIFTDQNSEEMHKEQTEIIRSLETLKLKYEIKRTAQYGTSTPTWKIIVYK